jgi:hypothetical protein
MLEGKSNGTSVRKRYRYSYPTADLDRRLGSSRLKLAEFIDNRHMKW